MPGAPLDPTTFLAVLLAFALVGVLLLAGPLLLGRLVRPDRPNPEKLEIYECGEPTIGSSRVQFDLRFYVVALLFLVFDVEVALLFPWAVVFGQANTLAESTMTAVARAEASEQLLGAGAVPLSATAAAAMQRIALVDLVLFFGIVLLGFAYIWKRGDLDWVRALTPETDRGRRRIHRNDRG